ncbi:DsbA family protein [Paracoccus suum]|uniref:DsbA family protein n=1 Tax=Paracoccus suum TaxID=2259340 RepID=A0A344PGK7_9RHOB|nr:DsbA family protein [Paracoccus suum]AXC48512.1 DsbA family protein [Paracoccus suum]
MTDIATPNLRRTITVLLASAALGFAALPVAAQTAAPATAPTTAAPAAPAAPAADAKAADATPAEPTPGPAPKLLDDIVLGQPDAPLTIIEYASFTCSHCADFAKENFPTLKSEYIDTGKVRFIQRDVYFDAVGLWSGILAHCEPTKYYPVGEMLLTTQDKWLAPAKSGDEVAANLRKVGLSAGMTEAQMDACWNDTAMIERLVATYQSNATKDGLEGTPTFIIGGEKVPNQAWKDLKAKIDQKLAEAEAKPAGAAAPATPAAPAN